MPQSPPPQQLPRTHSRPRLHQKTFALRSNCRRSQPPRRRAPGYVQGAAGGQASTRQENPGDPGCVPGRQRRRTREDARSGAIPKITPPPLVVPPIPPPVSTTNPAVGPALPAPKDDAPPAPVTPAAIAAVEQRRGKLPPAPASSGQGGGRLRNQITRGLLVQGPEALTIQPKPVEKKESAQKRTPIFGKLSQEDEIKLNAAQNAARLRDFNRAAGAHGRHH